MDNEPTSLLKLIVFNSFETILIFFAPKRFNKLGGVKVYGETNELVFMVFMLNPKTVPMLKSKSL